MILCMTKEQARNFILLKHGLQGEHKFFSKQGVLDFVSQAGCIQYDPIDVCGKNAELVLQSRVQGFDKQMLSDLLYVDRQLIDYFDKNLSILPVSDWPYFSRYRAHYRQKGRSRERIDEVCEQIRAAIEKRGPLSSSDLDLNETVDWYWNSTKLSRAALETMYFRGDLVIHHKKGTVKAYDLAENCLKGQLLRQEDPFTSEYEYQKWHVLRRIAAVGLLWNKASDAFLNIDNLNSGTRNRIFGDLLDEGALCEVAVEGMSVPLYCLCADKELAAFVQENPKVKKRCEFIAPLDNLLWDRKLISALFGFEYKWEIYTPAAERKYGYYVLPILYGNAFIGRIEAVNDRREKCLRIRNIWFEKNTVPTKSLKVALENRIKAFASFHGCTKTERDEKNAL